MTCDGWYACVVSLPSLTRQHHRINNIAVSNCAAAHVAYMLPTEPTAHHSEVTAICPVTPSSPMAEYIDE